MFRFTAENVREALPRGIGLLLRHGESQPSRNGQVLTYPEGPVATTYRQPKQHVLNNRFRDANPFFHLVEAMWMLAGREDAKTLDVYIKGFGTRFGHKGIIPDAYGYRWRNFWKQDQLSEVVKLLKADPNTRQAVVEMWNPTDQLSPPGIARPCNLTCVFRRRYDALDLTVFNRSNDIIWGAYGANAVHFSILLEYVALMARMDVGQYTQISNDFHMYMVEWERLRDNAGLVDDPSTDDLNRAFNAAEEYGPTMRLIDDPASFDHDLQSLWDHIDDVHERGPFRSKHYRPRRNPFLGCVYHMVMAYAWHKRKTPGNALKHLSMVEAADWRNAGIEWLTRRWNKASTPEPITDKV